MFQCCPDMGLRIPMISFVIIFLLIVWISFKIMHTKVCSYLVPSIPLPQSFLLTLFLNKVHHLVNSKGNVQVLCCLWSTMTRECVSVKHEHFLSVLGGLISLFSSLRMRMDTVVCVGSTRL